MSKRIIFLFILSIVLGFLSSVCSGADRGEILSGETKIGLNITAPSYMDTWTFNGSTGDRVIITAVTTSGSLNTEILLYPPGGGPVEHYLSQDDRLDHQLLNTGVYTILIQDYMLNDAGTYNISFLKIPGAVSSPEDPDGGPIASGQTLSGTINVASDIDAYQFYGVVGERVIIAAVNTSGSLNTEILLYPPGGGEQEHYLSQDDKADHQLLNTGVYTILIQDYMLNDAGTYNISFLKIPGAVSSPEDPDGGPIASGQTLSGTINVASDIDAYQFYGVVGERVIITAVNTSGSLNTEILLYPPGGGEQEHYLSQDDKADHQLLNTGVYTILIQDYMLNDAGTYNISFLKIPGAVSSPEDPDGGPIASGQTLSGTINVASDIDAYQVYGIAGDRVIIDAVTTSGSLNTEILLYPPGGGSVEHYLSQDDRLDHQLLETGLYTILIQDYMLNDTGTYNISLSKIPSDLRPGLYNPFPSVGDIVSDFSGSFSWDPVGGSTGYDLYFGENVIEPLVKIGDNLQTASMAFPGLVCGKTYYWHVVAHTPAGDIQGPYWWFRTTDCKGRIVDFDGDGKTDIAVWRPGDGYWYTISSKDGSVLSRQWGSSALDDVLVPGDYDGDGKTDYAVWRPGDGYWYIINSKDGSITSEQWGAGYAPYNDKPVPGDYDGDGKTDIAIWREADGYWYIVNSKDGSITSQQWGAGYDPYNDKPVPGDYDGDGKADFAIWRPADGYWYILSSKDGSITSTQWGSNALNDVLVPGDYDGDGKTDIAVWRPAEGFWYIISSKDGSIISQQWGAGYAPYNDVPVPGDYDGDGITDFAVWRLMDGFWYILKSSDGGVISQQWGAGYAPYNDKPISQ